MDIKPYLLSIVIPTKERYKYLLPLVQLIDSFNLPDTEIVIDDNSDDNSPWRKFVLETSINTPVVYNYVHGQISVRHNYENGIKHANGEYLCFLGDDDSVMPNILECVKWMKKNDIECLRQKTEITYKWPTYNDNQKNGVLGATLSYDKCTSVVEVLDAKQAAIDVIKSGFSSLGHCPCFYHGIVARRTLDKLFQIGGSYIPGPSPDMANAIALSFVVEKFCITDIPFVISGGSEFQGGRSAKVKTWTQPLSNVPFISDADKKAWDKRLPYIWCGPTVWPESGIKGLEYVGQESLESLIDFDELIARILPRVHGNDRRKVIKKAMNKNRVYYKYYKKEIRKVLSRVKSFFINLGLMKSISTRITVHNIMSISKAIDYLKNNENCLFEGVKI